MWTPGSWPKSCVRKSCKGAEKIYFFRPPVAQKDATFGAFRGIGEGDRLQGKAELIKCNDRYKMCYADVIPGGVTEGQDGRTDLLFIVYSSFASKTPTWYQVSIRLVSPPVSATNRIGKPFVGIL